MTAATSQQAIYLLDAGEDRVLSVQLDLSGDRQIERSYRVAFDDMARRERSTIDAARHPAFDREVERVREFLSATPPTGLGLIVHACEPADVWSVVSVADPLGDTIAFDRYPRVRALLDHADEHQTSAVALVDSEEARVFLIDRQQVIDSWDLLSLVPGRHKQGGWSQSNFQRHHDNVVDVHLRAVCDQLAELHQRRPFHRLVVGGPVEPVSRLRDLLPRAMRDRLAGTFEAEMFAAPAEVLSRASGVLAIGERADEARVVDQLREGAHEGGPAVLGFASTLAAVASRQVRTLVVADATAGPGAGCPTCDGLFHGELTLCPVCGNALDPVGDVVDEAMRRTVVAGGVVEIVHGDAAADLLGIGAGMGALLRYAAG